MHKEDREYFETLDPDNRRILYAAGIEDLIRHNAKSYPVIDNGRKVRNLSAEDLAQKMGVNNAPAEDFAKKRQEAEAKKPGLQLGSVNGQPVNGQPVNGPVIGGSVKQG